MDPLKVATRVEKPFYLFFLLLKYFQTFSLIDKISTIILFLFVDQQFICNNTAIRGVYDPGRPAFLAHARQKSAILWA